MFQKFIWGVCRDLSRVYALPKAYVDNRDYTGLTKVAENEEALYP